MQYHSFSYDDIGAFVQMSQFSVQDGVDEFHAIVSLCLSEDEFPVQLKRIYEAQNRLLNENCLNNATTVFKRYFLSDAVNQSPLMKTECECAAAYIQQPPLNGTKISVWMYLVDNVAVTLRGKSIVMDHNGYEHLWDVGMMMPENDSYQQTHYLLEQYQNRLSTFGANIADNCVRTWFFVRDVDMQYMPMVVARREFFENIGLNKNTHFISSTGICGVPSDPNAIIHLEGYAVKGLKKEQQTYISALTHLNPTHEYGVTFERGTKVEYGDRNHVIISGTASIDNKGEVMYVGDVKNQTLRMLENVEALLKQAKASFDDVVYSIVYLRDMADYVTVRKMFDEKFPNIPKVFTLAPVCRPTWLIEMECLAVTPASNPQFPNF